MHISVNKDCALDALSVRPLLVRVPVRLGISLLRPRLRLRLSRGWEYGHLAVKGRTDHTAVVGELLEDALHLVAGLHQASDEGSAFGGQITQLNTAAAEHCDGILVLRVLRFGDEFDRLAWPADLKLETSRRAALVRVRSADNG